ncbi:MAG: transporter substrate-binding domain-containing protein [Clostridia bacterium]|nr:transporter substrate-binding domain-containing protein [Clostridia bacterium]
MSIKKILACTLATTAAFATLSFTGCGKEKDTLIVYTEAGFAPWEFTALGTTDIIGVDMEIAEYIADKYDWELKVVNGKFDTIVAGIAEDNALGIAGISYSADRAEDVEFSTFYWGDAYQTVVYKTSDNPTLIDGSFAISNFADSKLVCQTGTTSQFTIEENAGKWGYDNTNTKSFDQVMVALEDMKTASIEEYLIVDSQVAAQLVAENDGISCAPIEGLEAEQYGIIAKKGNTDLIAKVNAALEELLVEDENGKTQIDKWFEEYSAIEAE